MRKTKTVVTQFCFYDRTGIQKMLEKQAQKGWMLESIGSFGWKYRKTEPKNLRFAVTYYPNASMFDPQPTVGEELYQEFVSCSGWQFVTSNAQLQVFCTEAEDPVPIETDALVELNNIHRAVKKSFLPAYCVMLACAMMNLALMGWRLYDNFTATIASNANLYTMFCWLALFGMELTEILSYFLWRGKAMKAAKLDGSFVETKNRNLYMWLFLAVVTAGYIWLLSSLSPRIRVAMTAGVAFILLMMVLMQLFTKWMKKQGFSREDNRAYTLIAAVFISVAVTAIFTWAITATLNNLPEDRGRDTFLFNGIPYTRSGDDLPLAAEELTGYDQEDYSVYKQVGSSLLVDQLVTAQYRKAGTDEASDVRYVVVDVKFAPLLDICLWDSLKMYHDQQMTDIFGDEFYGDFQAIDPAPWGADRAWQLYRRNAYPEYLLVYGRCIVNIELDEDATQEQMRLIAEVLGNEQNFENNENK